MPGRVIGIACVVAVGCGSADRVELPQWTLSAPDHRPSRSDRDAKQPDVPDRPSGDRIAQLAVTNAGLLTGTPKYTAPEMAAGPSAISLAADIFSFGSIAFELLTGKLPFEEPPILSTMDDRELKPPEPLAQLCDGLDPAVGELLDRCLAVTVDDRPSASELFEELSR